MGLRMTRGNGNGEGTRNIDVAKAGITVGFLDPNLHLGCANAQRKQLRGHCPTDYYTCIYFLKRPPPPFFSATPLDQDQSSPLKAWPSQLSKLFISLLFFLSQKDHLIHHIFHIEDFRIEDFRIEVFQIEVFRIKVFRIQVFRFEVF